MKEEKEMTIKTEILYVVVEKVIKTKLRLFKLSSSLYSFEIETLRKCP